MSKACSHTYIPLLLKRDKIFIPRVIHSVLLSFRGFLTFIPPNTRARQKLGRSERKQSFVKTNSSDSVKRSVLRFKTTWLRNLSALDVAKEFRLNVMAAERTYGRWMLLMKKEDGRERRETEGDAVVGQEKKVCTQNFKLSLSNLDTLCPLGCRARRKVFFFI